MPNKPTKYQLYIDVFIRLARETVACSPSSWSHGTLSIQSDQIRLTYQLKNKDQPDRADISEILCDQIDELYVKMHHWSDAWAEAELNWWRDEEGLNYGIAFDGGTPIVTSEAKLRAQLN